MEFKDLECLKRAAKKLGLEFRENQKNYKWYGTHVGDYPVPEGFTKEDLGKCDHALSIPQTEDNSGRAYEVGVVENKTGKGYTLLWDFWQGGFGLRQKIGDNGIQLQKEYAAQVAEKHLKIQGYQVRRKIQGNNILVEGY